jgi:UDP-3-O-[3-hydroxymyristoyl] glucosamine N-acyltransferase
VTPVRLIEIVAALGGELLGDGDVTISRIAALDSAGPEAISFLANPRFAAQLAGSRAACVIVAPASRAEAERRGTALIVDDPYLYYARLSQWWRRRATSPPMPGVHASAVIEAGARIAADASIGPLAFVGADAMIGPGAVVGAQAHVAADASVGEQTRIAPHAVIGIGCRIGARGIVHGGAVIGADGFGFAPAKVEGGNRWEKIEQLGAVWIGDDVEVGANTCIDRGALDDTVIDHGVKLDNLIQVAHNVRIGAHTALAGCVGIAGSTRIGRHCTAGGAAMILGHLELVDHVHVSAASVVSRSILKPGTYSGFFPIDDNASWEKNAATLRQLHALRERLRALEKKS